ncbi:23S rRNA (adenine(2030)-N(6))-methyltransferase RlmJ [Aestuariibacter sp. AA17]|uniref:Ribosomal RNA large subunit methyltransferase J n=1 Tax=Fluctibacter corallii TaxID=2984329 RepID=A0ABT3A704_9ALTE|nr:23S rRNA (adenine(2030)-N(6))-methyltransferase RlmJ [Aestuariibacter sp. AA17]MCV2884131.1 23S rRNA (adenine(2030)-N(6))-methyltransferase RlmJ [Aestuariibacter sp. AA17]
MLSYRHSFHAGNHGDVLKHLCQILLLDKLATKAKPYVYIDTHSGRGLYSFDSEQALKTREFDSGITRLMAATTHSPALNRYKSVVAPFYEQNEYPGSPALALSQLREQDSGILMELHSDEIHHLKRLQRHERVAIHHRDGFEGVVALTPPNPKRGLVLIDPPYEQASEYGTLFDALSDAIARWQTGVYAIWYPLLSVRAKEKAGMSEALVEKLPSLPVKSVLDIRLSVCENHENAGMFGSGMVIINAPWQFDEHIYPALEELTPLLATDSGANFSINWLKAPE